MISEKKLLMLSNLPRSVRHMSVGGRNPLTQPPLEVPSTQQDHRIFPLSLLALTQPSPEHLEVTETRNPQRGSRLNKSYLHRPERLS